MTHIPEKIFREYDIRGVVDEDISEDFAVLLGRAYGELLDSGDTSPVAIGHDCRLSSPLFAGALARGIASTGRNVEMLGMGPTPQVYFSLYQRPLAGGIQVTGSHNPSNMNGFKLCRGKQTLSGNDIQELKNKMIELKDNAPSATPGEIVESPIIDEYADYIIENLRPHMGERKLKLVVDAGNGVGGIVGPKILRECGAEVIELFCEPDGTFPNHHPDPTEMKNIVTLQETVIKEGADGGIGWDGDGDRIGVVDENGEVIFGDMLVLLFGRAILESDPQATIIGDVKCSTRLFDDLRNKGANAIMWKTGHSLIKKKLYETNAALAGEMSGHIFFKHRYFGFDDAMYASGRLLELMSKTDLPLSKLISDIPPAVSTPEIRLDCPEEYKFQVPEKAKEYFSDYPVDLTDGVRIEFENGWGLVRASNTQPALVMRFEAQTTKELDDYQSIVSNGVNKILSEISA